MEEIKDYGKIVSKNLKRIMYEHEKTQADVSRDLNINKATLSSWMTGTRVPRMKMVDILCNYFNVTRQDIMEEQSTVTDEDTQLLNLFHKLNPEGRAMALTQLQLLADSPKYTYIQHTTPSKAV